MTALDELIGDGSAADLNGLKYLKQAITGETVDGLNLRTLLGTLSEEDVEAAVEDQILRVYEKMNRTLTSIYDDNGRVFKQIQKYGASALMNKEYLNRSGLQTIFAEETTATFREAFPEIQDDIRTALDEFGSLLDETTSSKLRTALDSGRIDEVREMLYSTDETMGLIRERSLMSRLARGSEADDILGVYVNRSMAIASTLNQFDDFLEQVAGDEKAKRLLYGNGIGLISSELAIDKSTGFSLFKTFSAETSDRILRAKNIGDPLGYTSALRALERSFGTGLSVDAVGEQAIKELGSRVGKQTAYFENFSKHYGREIDKDLAPILDAFLSSERLSSKDKYTFAQGVVSGLKEYQEAYSGDAGILVDGKFEEGSRLAKMLTTFKGAVTEKSQEKAVAAVQEFFESSTSKYASSAKLQAQMAEINAISERMRKMGLSSIRSDQIDLATKVSDESLSAAKAIIERNRDELKSLLDATSSTDIESYDSVGKAIRLQQKIMGDFEEAMKVVSSGVSRQELFDALQKQSYLMGADFSMEDIGRTMHGTEEAMAFYREMAAARTNRASRFYGDISENQIASKILNKLNEAKEIASYAGAKLEDQKLLKGLLEHSAERTLDFNDVEQATIRAILGEDNPFEGLTVDQTNEARRARAVYGVREAEQKIEKEVADKLSSAGANTSRETPLAKRIRGIMAGEELFEEAEKTKYKRISNFIKDDLSTLFSENKVFRNSIYGIGALIAGSLIYSAVKDRSPESVGGPALLPGGSAYEDYPRAPTQVPTINPSGYSPGMSYKINLYGNRSDVDNFSQMVSGFGNFDTDTTIYSGIPEVGRDPYQELASSY